MATILAISPHLDDAVLSYGGRLASLASAGHEVTVYTVFAGSPAPPYSPAAIAYHAQWELTGDPVRSRREEDRRALTILGVSPLHGHYLDAVYRRNERGEWLIQVGEPTEYQDDEPALVAEIAVTIGEIIDGQRFDRMVTCAAIGEHADHKRARDAARLAAAQSGLPLAVWDDFPYIAWPEFSTDLPSDLGLSAPVAEPLTATALEKRNRAVRCYESQLAMLESDGIPLPRLFSEYCASHASSYGVTGAYEVTRQVTPVAARRPHAGHGVEGSR